MPRYLAGLVLSGVSLFYFNKICSFDRNIMLLLVVYIFCVLVTCAIGAWAAYSDFKGMVIPNPLVVTVMVLFFVAFGAAHFAGAEGVFFSLQIHLMSALVTFILTFILFATKVFGAGDAKLITAFSFWFGLKYLTAFLFYVAFLGGILGCIALVIKKKKPFSDAPKGSWIARLQAGEAIVPYGIAISLGAVFTFVRAGYISPSTMTQFLGG